MVERQNASINFVSFEINVQKESYTVAMFAAVREYIAQYISCCLWYELYCMYIGIITHA
jgi:hypothetical protein